MSDKDWNIQLNQQDETMPEASTKITISITTSPDTPPALLDSIMKGVARLITVTASPGELEWLQEQLEERRAQIQRQADHTARMLIGDEEPHDPA